MRWDAPDGRCGFNGIAYQREYTYAKEGQERKPTSPTMMGQMMGQIDALGRQPLI